MKNKIITALTFFLLLASCTTVWAQGEYIAPYYSKYVSNIWFSGQLGQSFYSGDLCNWNDFNLNRGFEIPKNRVYTLGVNYRLTNFHTVRVTVSNYKIYATDRFTIEQVPFRGLSFMARNWEISGVMIHDLVSQGKVDDRSLKLQPYVFVGLGLTTVNPKTVDGRTNLRKDQNEGKKYSPITLAFPMGFGVKYYIKHNLTAALEFNGRATISDYLDDVKARGSGRYKDFYYTYGIYVNYAKSFRFDYRRYKKKNYRSSKSK